MRILEGTHLTITGKASYYMISGIKLVIFDLDGVLIDSREAIVESFNRVLEELGEQPQPPDVIEPMIGEPLQEMFRRVLPAHKHGNIMWCWDTYTRIYVDVAPMKTLIIPGVLETLEYLSDIGLRLSIATTKKSDVATGLLSRLGILHYFELVLGINDVRSPKPSPEIIQLTLSKMGIKACEAIFVEDTTIGLEAGLKAGVHTIGVTTGTHSREKLMVMNPDFIIDDIRLLKQLREF